MHGDKHDADDDNDDDDDDDDSVNNLAVICKEFVNPRNVATN
jgi:hypothetical protein